MNIVKQITMHQLPTPEDSKHCCQLNLGIGKQYSEAVARTALYLHREGMEQYKLQ